MFKHLFTRLSLISIVSLAAGTALADTERANYSNTASPAETTGLVTGMIIGGATGGPPGAIAGAVIGILMGDGWNAKGQLGDLQADLYASRLEVDAVREEAVALQQQYQFAQQELDQLRSEPQLLRAFLPTQNTDVCCDNTSVSLHFRSGSSAVESHYEEQLTGLVKLAEQMPNASVEITGYADRNGDADLNLRLSRERSNSVKQFFTSIGMQNSSIKTIAYGETQPLQTAQSYEADFFDRRVIVRLRDADRQMLTQSPEGQ
jgi:sortase system peptidoglycan-associated protein